MNKEFYILEQMDSCYIVLIIGDYSILEDIVEGTHSAFETAELAKEFLMKQVEKFRDDNVLMKLKNWNGEKRFYDNIGGDLHFVISKVEIERN